MTAPLITFYDLDGSTTITLVDPDDSKEEGRPAALPARRSFSDEHRRAGREYLAQVQAIADRRSAPPAPEIVRVSHAYWHLFGDMERIARPLAAGSVVEFRCGPRWSQAEAEGAAFQISAILLKRQLWHTHAVVLANGTWFIQFIPLEVCS